MTLGPWNLFNHWLMNFSDAQSDIPNDDFYCVICGDGQALTRSFVGASTDCRYADLTHELPTANGYTVGGIILPNKTVTRVGGTVTLTSDPWSWTISADISGAKYAVLFNADSANDDLVAYCDLDIDSPGTNTVTIAPPTLLFTPHLGGIITWSQP